MKLTIKVLQGQECTIEVENHTTIQDIKTKLSSVLNVPVSQQKLLLIGKPLLDEKPVAFYNIKDGTKLSLIIKKESHKEPALLKDTVFQFFKKHYGEVDATVMTEKYMEDFERKTAQLSLDDLEKMAISFLAEGNK